MNPQIRYLILALTDRCNLKCSTCYRGDSLSLEDMSGDTIRQSIHIAATSAPSFHLQLTGGEPPLVPSAIETAVKAVQKTGRCQSIGIQTNATWLTPSIFSLFQAHQLKVGVSLDGPPEIHEQQRGMAAETLRGLQRLENAGISFGVTRNLFVMPAALRAWQWIRKEIYFLAARPWEIRHFQPAMFGNPDSKRCSC